MINRVIRTFSAIAAAGAMTLTAATFTPEVAGAVGSGQPFQCSPGFYQVIQSQLKILNPVTNVYTSIGSSYGGGAYNALGFNVLDNYIYGVKTPTANSTPKLLKVASDGSVTDLGTPTGVTIAPGATGSLFTAADMDNAGHLIAFLTTGSLVSINVANNVASLINLTKNGAATQVAVSDIGWLNGKLYGLSGSTLYSINATSGVVTTATVTGLSLGASPNDGTIFGATWSDRSDSLYFSNNQSGNIYKVTGYTGSSPSATKVATGTVTSNNDGAACKSASSPFETPTAVNDAYGASTNQTLTIAAASGVLPNDNGYGMTVTRTANASHGTVTLNSDGSFTYVPVNGYSGSDSFTYTATDSSGRTTNTATVTLTVSAGTLYTVTYQANGASGVVPTQGSVGTATNFTVASGGQLVKPGYTFGGWNDGSSTFTAGNTYTMGSANVTFTAQWTPNRTDTVTYDSQGGSAVSATTGLDGSDVTVANGPTRGGYTFTGWNTAANGSATGFAAGSSLNLTGDITLYAQWTANASVTLTYNSQGGSAVSSTNGLDGSTVTVANAPTKAGYTFVAWNSASDGTGTSYAAGSSYTLSGNATLFAKWTANASNTLSYDSRGGTAVSSSSGLQGTTVAVAAAPTRAGYAFSSWNTSSDGTGTTYAPSATYTLAGDATLYAQWTPNATNTLTYNSHGGSGVSSGSGLQGTTLTVASGPSRAGYTFNGWNTNAGGTGTAYAAGATYTLNGDATLHAQWTANRTDTVTYHSQGGSAVSSQSGLDGTTVTVRAAPTRAGYTFAGWNTLSDGTGTTYHSGDTLSLNAASIDLYAQWTPNRTDTLTYDSQGGTAVSGQSGLDGTTTTIASAPTRAGYTFANWYTFPNGTGSSYAPGSTYTFSGDVTLYASWTPKRTDTVTYYSQGGSNVSPQTGLEGTTVVIASGPTRAGYTFAGWNTAANGSGSSYAAGDVHTLSVRNLSLYAQWTANRTDTVSYDSQGGSAVGSQSGLDGTSITLTGGPTRAGYTFSGWNTAADGTGTNYAAGDSFALQGSADTTLFAQWTANPTVALTYDSRGGTSVDGATGLVGTTVTVSAGPTLDGYRFGEWNTAADGSGDAYARGGVLTFTADVTLYAIWTPNNESSIAYFSEGGSNVASGAYLTGTTVLVSSAPTRAGYSFNGWNTNADGSGTAYAGGDSMTLNADVELFAQWTRSINGGAFDCATGNLHIIDGQMNRVNLATGRTTPIGTSTQPPLNGMGYNNLDGFVYGMRVLAKRMTVVRVGSDGTVTVVGRPTGVTIPKGSTFAAGDMDDSGNLVARISPNQLMIVNVSTLAARLVPLVDSSNASVNVKGNDLVFVDGTLYALHARHVYAIDEATGVVTKSEATGDVAEYQNFGAGFKDSAGDLFYSANVLGTFVKVSPVSDGTYVVSTVSQGPGSVIVNDGASCPGAWNPLVAPTAQDGAYQTDINTTVNVGQRSGVLTGSTGAGLKAQVVSPPTSGMLELFKDGSFTYQPATGFTGTATFTFRGTDGFGSHTATQTVTITVIDPSDVPVAADQSYTLSDATFDGGGFTLAVPAFGGLLGGATGISPLEVSVVSASNVQGTLTVNADGSFTYSGSYSDAEYDASFTFNVTDPYGRVSATQTVTIQSYIFG